MTAPQASSRLEMLQARFQQKQLQEKEQKLLQLYDQQQQRAYQVVQRGSAGSNGSNHGTSISQQTITKTSSTSHTNTTSQGGKVRQMFDERRQTTVKGIDRSYPLEPLENKPRKQTNGNGVVAQKNGNLTVNRQSVTVRRVARADVNSNLNAGKPIVSYHEEITRESFGPSVQQQGDEDEFGNENHVARYANGNHRGEVRIEEMMDQDTIERNRMMAKLHLMEYDETLKHRVKNDLDSEEFPEDLMVDVPDRLPKRTVTKKLSQAEARLERFKNANARRSNISKNATKTSSVTKKRSDLIFPAKSTSRESESVRTGMREVIDRRWAGREKSARTNEPRQSSRTSESVEGTLSDSGRILAKLRNESPQFFCEESERSATTMRIEPENTRTSSPDSAKSIERSRESPELFSKESEKSATTFGINQNALKTLPLESSRDRKRRNDSPEFFCRESEKSATTMKIDPKTSRTLSPEFSKYRKRPSVSPEFFCKESEKSATTMKIDPKTSKTLSPEFSKYRKRPSVSPEFFCRESEKSATTMKIDPKTSRTLSPEFSKYRKRPSVSPEFFCKESEKSATTMKIHPKAFRTLSPEFSKYRKRPTVSPEFFCKESEKSATTMKIDPKTSRTLSPEFSKYRKRPSVSPEFFCRESEKSATTMKIDPKTSRTLSPEFSKYRKRPSVSPEFFCKESEKSATTMKIHPKAFRTLSPEFSKYRKRPAVSPEFFCKESEKSATTMKIDPKTSRTLSPEFSKYRKRPSVSPEFFCKESEKSATTMKIEPKTSRTSSPEFLNDTKLRNGSPEFFRKESTPKRNSISPLHSNSLVIERRNNIPKFFCRESERSATTLMVTPETIVKFKVKSPKSTEGKNKERTCPRANLKTSIKPVANKTAESEKKQSLVHAERDVRPRNLVAQYFSKESQKVAKNMYTNDKGIKSRSPLAAGSFDIPRSRSPVSLKDMENQSPRSGSPQTYWKESDKSAATANVDVKRGRSPSSTSEILTDESIKTPEFFCYETEKSATTVSLKPKSDSPSPRPYSRSTRSFEQKIAKEPIGKANKHGASVELKNRRSTKSPTESLNGLRSISLIREMIKGGNKNQVNYPRDQHQARGIKVTTVECKYNAGNFETENQSKEDRVVEHDTDMKVGKRATTPPDKTFKLRTPELSPKSFVSTEIDTEIPEITLSDQYVGRDTFRGAKKGTVTSKTDIGQTYSKLTNVKSPSPERSGRKNQITYSVCKPGKKRGSLLKSNIFEPMTGTGSSERSNDRKMTLNRDGERAKTVDGEGVSLKQITRNKSSTEERCSSSPSPTNETIFHATKRRTKENAVNQDNGAKKEILRSREQTPSPTLRSDKETGMRVREKIIGDSMRKKSRLTTTSQNSKRESGNGTQTLRSMELVKAAMGGQNRMADKDCQKLFREKSPAVGTVDRGLSKEYYERTDSVESALRRFDSIGTDSGTITLQFTPESNRESLKYVNEVKAGVNKSQTVVEKEVPSKLFDEKQTDSPKTAILSQATPKKTPPVKLCNDKFAETTRGTSTKISRTRGTPSQNGFVQIKGPMEIRRNAETPKSPACKRKLFQDTDPEERTFPASLNAKCSVSCITKATGSTSSPKFKTNKSGILKKKAQGPVPDKKSANLADPDLSVSVHQLRSIKDIRMSIENESPGRVRSSRTSIATMGKPASKSVIANKALRSNGTKSVKQSPLKIDDRPESRKQIFPINRSENVPRKSNNSRGSKDSDFKIATRFSRIAKSPSPDPLLRKASETSNRTRRSVPSSPSKSPDTLARRPSTDLRAQDTKSTKRPTPTKGTEPTGNRKTTTTTRKSTDVVDVAVFENGLHLQDQPGDIKYDNDSSTVKKSDAFIIDFDAQPPKENDTAISKKPLLRKQSSEKQFSSTHSGRPTSSVSSVSSGNSMQGQTSGIKGRMSGRAKTPISGASPTKGPPSGKSGGAMSTGDTLVPCKMCGRRFAQERVTLHEQICTKTVQKKRKQFDTMMYRVRGTDLEPFVKKGIARKQNESKPKKPEVKSNWRRKHEDFINAIRSAKQVQAHLAAGGKLSDLPPPPASDTSDYIQCPHCGRKFNQAAAERHIPKCEHMLHNKPVQSRAPKPRR